MEQKNKNFFFIFSAGIFGGAAIFEIIPEVVSQVGVPQALTTVTLGFLGWLILGRVKRKQGERIIILTSVAIWLHSFLEGAFVALSFAYSLGIGLLVALGMVIHLAPELVAVIGILQGYGASFKKALKIHGITIGFLLLGFVVLSFVPFPRDTLIIILGATAGAFLLISLSALRKSALTIPLITMYIIGFGTALLWKFIFP